MKADDCIWNLADNCVELTLTKAEGMHWWSRVMEGDMPIDTQQVEPENSKLEELDPETRKTVEKMMVGGWGGSQSGGGVLGGILEAAGIFQGSVGWMLRGAAPLHSQGVARWAPHLPAGLIAMTPYRPRLVMQPSAIYGV